MAPASGKKKRRESLDDQDHCQSSVVDKTRLGRLQDAYRQHFEAKFEPLSPLSSVRDLENAPDVDLDSEQGSSSGSNFEGLSEAESEAAEVVLHTSSARHDQERSHHEHKSFMSARPPQILDLDPAAARRPNLTRDEDAETDHANLKKDLALQRLLQESHLLDKDSSNSYGGETRHKALDMRFQKLGSKSSIFTQNKMPLAQRKGIANKAAERLETRRREARENGIILEKVRHEKKDGARHRQRNIDAPSVGRFRKGMLTLSRKDVREIHGPKRSPRW